MLNGRKNKHGLPSWVGEDRLIPLKALAWMEMNERVQRGETIDSKKINKHLSDVVQLSALLQPNQVIALPNKITANLQIFVQAVAALNRPEHTQIIARLVQAYALN